jgi:hypothetical protein
MMRIRVGIIKRWWLGIAVLIFIGAAAPPVLGQACCRCDFSQGGQPASCNTGGIPDQSACEEICSLLNSSFGDFQTCPPGMVDVGCSSEPNTYCDISCAVPAPSAAPVPTTSTGGTLVAVVILVALGGYTLSRRREL